MSLFHIPLRNWSGFFITLKPPGNNISRRKCHPESECKFQSAEQSAQRTLGGGRVLDGAAPARNRRTPARLAQLQALRQESLEEALLAFPGCVVVTSHDRWFLDRIATHILAWEGTDENPGNWHWFEGNFDDYQKNRVERLGEEAARPHRIHRKLTRD